MSAPKLSFSVNAGKSAELGDYPALVRDYPVNKLAYIFLALGACHCADVVTQRITAVCHSVLIRTYAVNGYSVGIFIPVIKSAHKSKAKRSARITVFNLAIVKTDIRKYKIQLLLIGGKLRAQILLQHIFI